MVTRAGGYTQVTIMHGSMNYLYPGTDDYMVAAATWDEARPVLHGLVRAMLIV